MSTIKSGQSCYTAILIKPYNGTSFQSPAFNQKHVRNVSHTTHKYLTKFHFDSN